jgi:hypothetical protein
MQERADLMLMHLYRSIRNTGFCKLSGILDSTKESNHQMTALPSPAKRGAPVYQSRLVMRLPSWANSLCTVASSDEPIGDAPL